MHHPVLLYACDQKYLIEKLNTVTVDEQYTDVSDVRAGDNELQSEVHARH